MPHSLPSTESLPLAPLAQGERIEALDVVRGFALIGILLMNIEFFNRPLADLGSGMQTGLSGADLAFSTIVMYFVVGKFWTMFSLLFGMGFGVMLTRSDAAGRDFLPPYLRRIAALALFGALHGVLIWGGDILFSYAVAALCLLIALFGRGKYIVLGSALLAALGLVSKLDWPLQIAGCLGYFAMLAWYLRCPDSVTCFGAKMPVFKIVTRLMMLEGVGAIVAGLVVPDLPHIAHFMLPWGGALVLVLSLLMVRFHNPIAARPWRAGVGMYTFSCLMLIGLGASQHFFPDPADAPGATLSAVVSAPDKEKAKERLKEKAKERAEHKAEIAREAQVMTRGSYQQAVALRGKHFVEHAAGQFGFAIIVVNMFLLGLWFIRSGIMSNTRAHLPLFRRLALIGIPLGVGLGLLGGSFATHAVPGTNDGFTLATGLLRLGNLPACLGYVGLVILLLNSASGWSRIRVLGPFGRMALTNYLTHSVVFSLLCYGYGLGYFGIARAWQLPCVLVMVGIQIPLSHWWLSKFRYGPMEWLWRAITYWTIPAMRRDAGPALQSRPL